MAAKGRDQQSGVIAGSVLAAARRTSGSTQEELAEAVGAHPDTVKSWESGRRSLASVQAGQVSRVRRSLLRLGAEPGVIGKLDAAIDADEFTAEVISGDCTTLASEVITRPWTGLVGWAVGQGAPAGMSGRNGLLPAASQAAFFASVRAAAERAQGGSVASLLLRRQACYLAAWDPSPDGTAWLAEASRAGKQLRIGWRWTPEWPVARSLAVARACQGDPEPLQRFIRDGLDDQDRETANLVYWAYWIGAIPEPAADDGFMAQRNLTPHQSALLLQHLAGALGGSQPYAELTAHTAAVLVTRTPGLLDGDPALAAELDRNATRLLDTGSVPRARRDLDAIRLAMRDLNEGRPRHE